MERPVTRVRMLRSLPYARQGGLRGVLAALARSRIARVHELVPRDFDVPSRLETPQFVLELLGPKHNEQAVAP